MFGTGINCYFSFYLVKISSTFLLSGLFLTSLDGMVFDVFTWLLKLNLVYYIVGTTFGSVTISSCFSMCFSTNFNYLVLPVLLYIFLLL